MKIIKMLKNMDGIYISYLDFSFLCIRYLFVLMLMDDVVFRYHENI